MKYVIQMQDGSYYCQGAPSVPPTTVFTTTNLVEAARFDTRWEALMAQAQGKQFAYSKIVFFNPPPDEEQGNASL